MGALACHGVWAALFLWEGDGPHARPSAPPSPISVVFEKDVRALSDSQPTAAMDSLIKNQQNKDDGSVPVEVRRPKALAVSKGKSETKPAQKKAPSKHMPPSLVAASHSVSPPSVSLSARQNEAARPQDKDVQPLVAPPPVYPDEARRRGEEETILVRAFVDMAGRVTHVSLVKGTSSHLVRAALDGVRAWQFPPQVKNAYTVLIPLSFSLNGQEQVL